MDRPLPHRFAPLQKNVVTLDEGTFVWEYENAPLAFEAFAMVRWEARGFLKKKRTGMRLLSSVTSPDGSFDLESCWEYDKRLFPTHIEVINRGQAVERDGDKRAVFSFGDENAQLKMGSANNLTALNIGYESGWLVAVEPSIMPYIAMLGRYDMTQKTEQSFTVLRTSAMDNFFTLTKIHLSLKHVRSFDAPEQLGKRTQIHCFSGSEKIVERDLSKASIPHRTVHLWCDGDKRLRKVLFATDAQDVTAIRQGDEDLSSLLRPREEASSQFENG